MRMILIPLPDFLDAAIRACEVASAKQRSTSELLSCSIARRSDALACSTS
jgi:hypothetical protein